MHMRIWRTGFDPRRLDDLQRFADEISTPMFRRLPGCTGHMYAVSGEQWITTSFWDSPVAITRAEASADYRSVVDRILAAGFLAGEQTTEVFEVTGLDLDPDRRA